MLVALNAREFQEHRDESRCRRHECPRHVKVEAVLCHTKNEWMLFVSG
jgi:hypothetical protein